MGDKTPPPSSIEVPNSQKSTVLLPQDKTFLTLNDYKGTNLNSLFGNVDSSNSDSDSDTPTVIVDEPSEEEKAKAKDEYLEMRISDMKRKLNGDNDMKRKLNGDNDMYNERVKETGLMDFNVPLSLQKKYKPEQGGRRSKKRKSKKRKTKKRKTKKNKKSKKNKRK
jgi:hypothetical protein